MNDLAPVDGGLGIGSEAAKTAGASKQRRSNEQKRWIGCSMVFLYVSLSGKACILPMWPLFCNGLVNNQVRIADTQRQQALHHVLDFINTVYWTNMYSVQAGQAGIAFDDPYTLNI